MMHIHGLLNSPLKQLHFLLLRSSIYFCSCLNIWNKSLPENSRLYFVIELNTNTNKQYHLDCEGSEMEMTVMETGQYIIQRTKISIMLSYIKAKKLFPQYFVN